MQFALKVDGKRRLMRNLPFLVLNPVIHTELHVRKHARQCGAHFIQRSRAPERDPLVQAGKPLFLPQYRRSAQIGRVQAGDDL